MQDDFNSCEGVLLCSVGESKYYSWCNTLIKDIRSVMPEVPIAVFTDSKKDIVGADFLIIGRHVAERKYASKIKACQKTPFKKTIFIDVDSRLIRSVKEVYDILDFYDLALCLEDGRSALRTEHWRPSETGIPYSSSTFAFRKNKTTDELLETWLREYTYGQRFPGRGDQGYLSYAIYHSPRIRHTCLPCEYRFNSSAPQVAGSYVKIITSLISDQDPKGDISNKELDKLINYKVGVRCLYFKLFGKGGVLLWSTDKKS